MAVYAGMLDSMDQNIGKVIDYLKETNQYDNTVVMFVSDNGADFLEQEKITPQYYKDNFDLSYEELGEKGSYSNYGPGWASAANGPLTNFKGSAGEGAMRVPFIVKMPNSKAIKIDEFAYVTDITPTILDIAGIEEHGTTYKGREVAAIDGVSMLAILNGEQDYIHADDEVIGYELAGSVAIFKGDYKVMKNSSFFGDGKWRLFNIKLDPTESFDLSEEYPEIFEELKIEYKNYVEKYKVIEVPEDYDIIEQLKKNYARKDLH